jgi:hypothetical protein
MHHSAAAYLVYRAFNDMKTIYLIYMSFHLSLALKKKGLLLFIIFLIIIIPESLPNFHI